MQGKDSEIPQSLELASPELLTVLKPLTVWIKTNWKILKKMGIPDHLTLPASCEICMRVKKQQLELDMK